MSNIAVNAQMWNEEKELEKLISKIGFFSGIDRNGNELTYHPGKDNRKSIARLFRRGGVCTEARDDEEARVLENNGFVEL